MFKHVFVAVMAMLSIPAFAQGATDASVERLFAAMNVERSISSTYAMMENMMNQSMAQVLPADPTPQQRKAIEAATRSFSSVMRDEISWEKMKPDMVRSYSETFTEAEVLGIVAFYESPAGQAFVQKMPQLMQKSMALTQERMKLLVPRMKAAVEKAALEAKAAEAR